METSGRPQRADAATVILASDAAQHGITRANLRSTRFRPLFHGIHLAASEEDDTWNRAHAVVTLAGPGAVASFHTAARLWGAAVPNDPTIHVTVPHADQRRCLDGATFHVCGALEWGYDVRGVLVTSPAQTFIDLARKLPLVALVVVGDALVNHGHITPEDLRRACARSSLKGAVQARRAARYVRRGAESPMETRARMLVVLAGLPEPRTQIEILDGWRVIYRLDLGYAEALVAVEYDGEHHRDPDQAAADTRRREYLESIGWIIVVLRSEDIYRHPDTALEQIVAAMRRRGLPVPRRLDPTWQRHFPTR